MSVIEIETAMKHCRADDEDASMVQTYLNAAEDHAAKYLGRKFYRDQSVLDAAVTAETAGLEPLVLTPSIEAACLLITGHLFAHRENVVMGLSFGALPQGSDHLLFPYRIGMGI
jgi:hypothetical protein